METDELESRLDGGQETQSFEVKGPMMWEPRSLAKDILAMSNLRDGGVILIGVEDGTFARIGVTDAEAASFDIDIMRDQISKYADPLVDFTVAHSRDRAGLLYVAIRVSSFREIPVICAADSSETRAGVLYYRSTNRRIESAPVSNAYDMRDIVTLAAIRTRQRLAELGVPLPDADETAWSSRLDKELNGL